MEFESLFRTRNGVVWATTDAEGHEVWALFPQGEEPWQWSDGAWYSPAAELCGYWVADRID